MKNKDMEPIDRPVPLPALLDDVNDLDVEHAPLPVVYEAAKNALAVCERIDECKDWANKAAALASYARQSKDDTLMKHAMRIQAQAITRCGEILQAIPRGDKFTQYGQHADVPPVTRNEAATQAGLGERQKKEALRVASVPKEIRDALIESDDPPTITQLAAMGTKKKNVVPLHIVPLHSLDGIDPRTYRLATELLGGAERFASFLEQHDPEVLIEGIKDHEFPRFLSHITKVSKWLEKFNHVYNQRFKQRIGRLVDERIQNGDRVNPDWITQEILNSHKNITGSDTDFHRCASRETVREHVRSRINSFKITADKQGIADKQLVLPGYERLQKAYLVEEGGAMIAVPVEKLSRTQLDLKITELEAMGDGCHLHADELRRYRCEHSMQEVA